ncbi:hypothetical protein HRG84_23140 [Flavisolibacter sp. BT320]|nr:hypothetical protein [Flavisolibacter longurius]
MHQYKPILVYTGRFLGLFAILFYGTEAVIAFASPGDHYWPWLANNLNFIPPFRMFLMRSAQALLAAGGWQTGITDAHTLAFPGGASVRMVYSCLGYGVLSFWIAFIFANRGSWQKKSAWMLAGALALVGINIVRIALILLAAQKGWAIPLGWDHHTWFNIVAYLLIFAMIWGYDRSGREGQTRKSSPAHHTGVKTRDLEQTASQL